MTLTWFVWTSFRDKISFKIFSSTISMLCYENWKTHHKQWKHQLEFWIRLNSFWRNNTCTYDHALVAQTVQTSQLSNFKYRFWHDCTLKRFCWRQTSLHFQNRAWTMNDFQYVWLTFLLFRKTSSKQKRKFHGCVHFW